MNLQFQNFLKRFLYVESFDCSRMFHQSVVYQPEDDVVCLDKRISKKKKV